VRVFRKTLHAGMAHFLRPLTPLFNHPPCG
jgi:hypothetical protein